MGTRNLTAVKINGEYKIAQYGQWDGYPSGQGKTILEFLNFLQEQSGRLAQFKEKLSGCSFLTQEELEEINAKHGANWKTEGWGHLSRDHGANILSLVFKSDIGLKLNSELDFASDSLMCKYAYVIDFDAKQLEVYTGFNKKPPPIGERFYSSVPDEDGYYPVHLSASYDLLSLPTIEQMSRDVDGASEDEEDAA